MNSCHLPLHKAVRENKLGRIKRLVGGGRDVNEKDDRGRTPLHIAAIEGNAKSARLLLNLEADVDALDENALTPLHICAEKDKTGVLIVLLEHRAKLDAVDNKTRTALHIAAENDRVEMVTALIEKGARLDIINEDGDNALFVAIENGCCDVVVEMLRHDSEGIIHATDPSGKTALHVAVAVDNVAIAKALITAGARKDLRDEDNKTPRDYVKDEHVSMKELLATCEPQNSGDPEVPNGRRARMSFNDMGGGLRNSFSSQSSRQTIEPQGHCTLQGHCIDVNGVCSSASSFIENQSDGSSSTSGDSQDWMPTSPFGSRPKGTAV